MKINQVINLEKEIKIFNTYNRAEAQTDAAKEIIRVEDLKMILEPKTIAEYKQSIKYYQIEIMESLDDEDIEINYQETLWNITKLKTIIKYWENKVKGVK